MIGTNTDHPSFTMAESSSQLGRERQNKKEIQFVPGERTAPQCSFSSCPENAAIDNVSSNGCLKEKRDGACTNIPTTSSSTSTSRMDDGGRGGREDVFRGGGGVVVSSQLSAVGQWEKIWDQYFASYAPDFEKFLGQDSWIQKCQTHLLRGVGERNIREWKSSGALSSLPLSSLFKGAEVLVPVMGDKESGKTSFIQNLLKKECENSSSQEVRRVRSSASTGVLKICIYEPGRERKESPMWFMDYAEDEVYQSVHSRSLPEAEIFVIVWNVATSGLTEDGGLDDKSHKVDGGGRGGVRKCVASILARFPEARFVLVGTGIDKIHKKGYAMNALTQMRVQVKNFIEKVLSFSTSSPPSSILPGVEEEGNKLEGSEKSRKGRGEEGKKMFDDNIGERNSRSSRESCDFSFSAIPFVVGNFGVSCTKDEWILEEFPERGKWKQGTAKKHLLPFLLQEVRRIQQYRLDDVTQSDLTFFSSLHDSLNNFVQEIKELTNHGGSMSLVPQLLPASSVVEGVVQFGSHAEDALQKEKLRRVARVMLKGLHDWGSVFWLEQYSNRNSTDDETKHATLSRVAVDEEESDPKGFDSRVDGMCHVLGPTRKSFYSSPIGAHTSSCPLCHGSGTWCRRRSVDDGAEVKCPTDCCCGGMLVLRPEAMFHFIYIIFSFSLVLRTPRSLRYRFQPLPYSITKAEEQDQLSLRKGYLRFPLAVELWSSEWCCRTGENPTDTDILMLLSLLVTLGLGYPVLEGLQGEAAVHSEKPVLGIFRKESLNISRSRSTLLSTAFFSRAEDLNSTQDEYGWIGGTDGRRMNGTSAGTRRLDQRVPIGIFLPSLSPETCPWSLRSASPLLFCTGARERYRFDSLPPALWHRWQCYLHPFLHFLSASHKQDLSKKEAWEDFILFPKKPPEATDHHNRWVDACWLRLVTPNHDEGGIGHSPTPTVSNGMMGRGKMEEKKEVDEVRGFLYYEGTYPCEVFLWVSEPGTALLTRRLIHAVKAALVSLLEEFPGVHMKHCGSAVRQKRGEGTWRVGRRKGSDSVGGGGGGTEYPRSVQERSQSANDSPMFQRSSPYGILYSSSSSLSSSSSSLFPISPTRGVYEDHLEKSSLPTGQDEVESLQVPRKVFESTSRPVKHEKKVEEGVKQLLEKFPTREEREFVCDVLHLGQREKEQEKSKNFSVRNPIDERREENDNKGFTVTRASDGSASPTCDKWNTLRKVDVLDMLVKKNLC